MMSSHNDKEDSQRKGMTSRPEGHARETESPLLGPAALALFSFLAGPMVSGPAVGAVLVRLKQRKTGLGVAFGMLAVGIIVTGAIVFWPVKWYWGALSLLAVHLSCAGFVFYTMRALYKRLPQLYLTRFSPHRRQEMEYIFIGMICGTTMCILLGVAATIGFLIVNDRMFATLMPVVPTDGQSLTYFFTALLSLGISGFIAGGYAGRHGLKVTPAGMLLMTATLIFVSLSWLLVLELVIAIPGFQAGQSAPEKWAAAWFPFITGNLLIGVWWNPFLFSYIIKPYSWKAKLFRLAQTPFIHLAAAMSLAIFFGYANNFFHAAGRYFERQARMPAAVWSYEQGLKKNPSAASASYLQYRIALLAHKLGREDKARQGFRNVVSKYTNNEELVKKANRFLDSMDRNGNKGTRVVLPGVEAHIAYKGSYCVPNSLALVMRFWGFPVDARNIGQRITGLSRGTMIVDQAWYAEQEGFRHDFLPNASMNDIKAAIDAGFPVMVYVPSHVFVIVGYDDILETFVTYDVATNDVWVDYVRKDFVKSWKKQGTTLVLAYPPEMRSRIPEDIEHRLVSLSEGYLHYHLYATDSPESYAGSNHLLQAAGDDDIFFIPLTVLYNDFPGLRPALDDTYPADAVSGEIYSFFSTDFDEGIHLWGQYHDDDNSEEDETLGYSLKYLIGNNRLDLARNLISRIEEQGPISDKTKNIRGMIDLAQGDFVSGINRLNESEEMDLHFYLALAELQSGNTRGAVSGLVKTVDNCT